MTAVITRGGAGPPTIALPACDGHPREDRAVAKTEGAWADTYRSKWTWDKVSWGSHSVDCYPGGCPWRVYTKDGRILREEQSGTFPTIEPGVPDMNPMGCQKGASWSHCHYSQDRVTHPLKRVGERGEGKFERVSWDEALTDIADGILDAIQTEGAASIINLFTPEPGAAPARMFSEALGLPLTDGNAEFQDFSPGWHLTWGLFNPTASMDDWFLAELTLIWHANPVYTNIHWYHYVAESRYNGGEVVTIAPDYSPSAIHADYHVPVRIGTDAALALSMCKVIIDAGLYKKQFVQEQTDLPLLVRKDTGRFLRGSDVAEGDRDDQFFWWDTLTGTLSPGAPTHAGDDRHRPRARGQLQRDAEEPPDGGGGARLRALAPASRGLHAREGGRDLRGEPGQHPQARAQGGDAEDQDLHRLELGQVLPRRPDGALHGAAARAHGQLGQEGHRHALVGDLGHGRRDLPARQGGARSGGGAEADRGTDRDAAADRGERSDDDARDDPEPHDGARQRHAERPRLQHAAGLPLVLPVRLQGALERPGEPRSLVQAQLRRVHERGDREGLVGSALCEGLPEGDAARALRSRRQRAPPPARRTEAAARESVAEAEADRLGGLPADDDRPPLGLRAPGGPALREARPLDAVGAPHELRALRPRGRTRGRSPAGSRDRLPAAREDRGAGGGARA